MVLEEVHNTLEPQSSILGLVGLSETRKHSKTSFLIAYYSVPGKASALFSWSFLSNHCDVYQPVGKCKLNHII